MEGKQKVKDGQRAKPKGGGLKVNEVDFSAYENQKVTIGPVVWKQNRLGFGKEGNGNAT